ncbi:MAG: Pyruvate-ferrodoxin oxidoreductase, partial [Streblomastix strix]
QQVTLSFPSTTQSLFYVFGADGTVGSIKDAIQIIGDNTDLYSQAHFVYDAKKSGGVTITHVRFGHSPITSQYEIQDADYLACHHPSYVRKYDMLNYSKEGSVFVLNGPWENVETLSKVLPYQMKKAIVQKKLKFYVINAEKIAASVGLPGRVNNVMQTVFFYLSEVIKPIEQAIEFQKKAIEKTFKKKGMQVVEQNWKCVDSSVAALIKIDPPKDWGDEEGLGKFDEIPVFPGELPPFFKNVAGPVLALKGEELKVSDLMLYKGGILPTDTARYEKRNVSANVPIWDEQKCVQCNLCSFLCPHASIRPYLVREKEAEEATTLFSTKPSSSSSPLPSSPYKLKYAKQKGATNSIAKIIVDEEGKEIIRKQGEEGKGEKEEELLFAISVTTADCMGCTICVGSCPAKALAMQPNLTAESFIEQDYFDYLSKLPNRAHLIYNEIEEEKKSKEKGDAFLSTPAPNSKNLSFKQPLLEFSGACAGCAESTLAKVVTQLVGKRMVVATACGCSMVWGGTEPSCAYSIDRDTQLGPTYTGSLFEDTSELALGLAVGGIYMRDKLKKFVQQIVSQEQKKEEENEKDIVLSKDLLNSFAQWLNEYENPSISVSLSLQINSQLKKITGDVFDKIPIMKEIQSLSDLFLKKSYWCFGGDGFAYDIGFGGLDQVLQMGVNLNILIYDTEVYSNTGGQKSKSTPRGAIARFAAAGKETQKKDLGLYAVGLRCCYVANIAQGANPLQTVKALHEAEEFPGTSIVIALCPCINWGLKGGQSKSVEEQKLAVKTGYWPLFRYNPLLSKEGKNPFILDSAAPSDPVSKLLERETRFDSLKQQSPETAKLLHEGLQRDIDDRYKRLAAMAKGE